MKNLIINKKTGAMRLIEDNRLGFLVLEKDEYPEPMYRQAQIAIQKFNNSYRAET